MKIKVEHVIPYDKDLEKTCMYSGDFWGKPLCSYLVYRDRYHGRKQPMERRVPKCTLFNRWLERDCMKCPECLEAVKKAKEDNA